MEAQNSAKLSKQILKFGIAFAFLYPPVSAFFNPYAWTGYFPEFITTIPISELYLLHIFGLIEIGVALWILSGKNLRLPLAIATTMLGAIVVFNLNQLDVLFRDIPIIGMCMALYLLHYPPIEK